jgi:superfamily II DNA/RNA helicase
MAQVARDRVMESFRNRKADVLVATNVAARGLDLTHVGLVVNYELPESADAMTHRVGRTARNGKAGRALTFITATDHEKWSKLRRQGAPALRTLDAAALARDGGWSYLHEQVQVHVASRSQVASAQTAPSQLRRRRRTAVR